MSSTSLGKGAALISENTGVSLHTNTRVLRNLCLSRAMD